jgi:hypothetical protein
MPVKVLLVRAFQVADLLATVIFDGMPGQAGHMCFLCGGNHDGGGEFVGGAKVFKLISQSATTPPRIKKGSQGSRGSWMPLRKLKPSHDSL